MLKLQIGILPICPEPRIPSHSMNIIKTLGRSENDKILIIHADDAGLSQSANMATIQALKRDG